MKSNKNDAADAEAICEAAQRANMRFVAVKTVEQQDIQAIHRVRSPMVAQRTAQINQTFWASPLASIAPSRLR